MGKLIDDLIKQIFNTIDLNSLRIKKISKGFRFTCTMLEDGSCGMCFSIFNQDPIDSCKYIQTVRSFEELEIGKIFELAKNLENDLERVIGISTINAFSQHILKKKANFYQILLDTDPIDHLKFKMTDRVVMIGNIGGFLSKIQNLVKDVVVIDESLRELDSPYFQNPETSQEYLNQSDIVFITGSAIANNTMETLLKWSSNAKDIVVVGPSAGMIPDPLFDRGVTIVSGMQVLFPDKVLQIIEEGAGTPHFKKYCRKYNIIQQ